MYELLVDTPGVKWVQKSFSCQYLNDRLVQKLHVSGEFFTSIITGYRIKTLLKILFY